MSANVNLVVKKLLAVLALAATLAGTATAATISDLQTLGYTVTVSNPGNYTACGGPIYYVTGFGNSSYFQLCDSAGQALVDGWANPVAFCNVRWQYDHPEQYAAFNTLLGKNYAVSGDQCADSYTVSNGYTGAVVYSGKGAGLPNAAGALSTAQASASAPGGSPVPQPAASCLPLCPSPVPTEPTPSSPAATTTASPTSPALVENPAAPTVEASPVTLTTTVSLQDLRVARNTPASGSTPLLTAALTHALGSPVKITAATSCYLGGKKVGCASVFARIRNRSVRFTVMGTTVKRLNVA